MFVFNRPPSYLGNERHSRWGQLCLWIKMNNGTHTCAQVPRAPVGGTGTAEGTATQGSSKVRCDASVFTVFHHFSVKTFGACGAWSVFACPRISEANHEESVYFSRSSFPCFEKSFLCQRQLCLSDSSLELLLSSCAIRILTTTKKNMSNVNMATKASKEVKPQTAPFPWTLRTCRFLACCPDQNLRKSSGGKTREIWSWKLKTS